MEQMATALFTKPHYVFISWKTLITVNSSRLYTTQRSGNLYPKPFGLRNIAYDSRISSMLNTKAEQCFTRRKVYCLTSLHRHNIQRNSVSYFCNIQSFSTLSNSIYSHVSRIESLIRYCKHMKTDVNRIIHFANSRSLCYKSGDNTKESDPNKKQSTEEEVQKELSDDDMKNYPELKQLLDSIEEDFVKPAPYEKTSDSDINNGSNTSFKTSGLDNDADSKVADQLDQMQEDDYSFYEVAEDIEEYEYKDMAEMSSHQIRPEKELPISLERGSHGVFDLDELLVLLEHLGAENIVTIPVPPEANFCEHMVIVTAKSRRHMTAINEEMLWVHKRKKSHHDIHLKVEGLHNNNWSAMDMGHIVLHLFLGNTRQYFDLESLWTLGPEHDPKCQGQSHDPYALSPEDLFWLETENASDQTTESEDVSASNADMPSGGDGGQTESREVTDKFTEQQAGWNEESTTSHKQG